MKIMTHIAGVVKSDPYLTVLYGVWALSTVAWWVL